jgi:phage internal scaffolding protein
MNNLDKYRERKRVTVDTGRETKTQQSLAGLTAKEIMERHQRTNTIPVHNLNPQYGVYDSGLQLQEALQITQDALDEFDGLPKEVRKRFNQDPSEIIDFLANENNRDEAIKLGLIEEEVKETPVEVRIISDESVNTEEENPPAP